MIKRILVILVLLFAFIEIGFCTDYSACNSAVPAGNHKLTQDVSTSTNCFTLTADNTTFDCQGYTITGGSGYGFVNNIDYLVNITIKNCIIKDFSSGLGGAIGPKDFNFGIGYSYLENLTLYNDSIGVYFTGGTKNELKNIKINTTSIGV